MFWAFTVTTSGTSHESSISEKNAIRKMDESVHEVGCGWRQRFSQSLEFQMRSVYI